MIYDDVVQALLEAARRKGPPPGATEEEALKQMREMLLELQAQKRHDKKVEYMLSYRKRRKAMACAAGTMVAIATAGTSAQIQAKGRE